MTVSVPVIAYCFNFEMTPACVLDNIVLVQFNKCNLIHLLFFFVATLYAMYTNNFGNAKICQKCRIVPAN